MPKEANQIIHRCIIRSKSIGREKTVSGKDKKLLGWLTVRLRWMVYRIEMAQGCEGKRGTRKDFMKEQCLKF